MSDSSRKNSPSENGSPTVRGGSPTSENRSPALEKAIKAKEASLAFSKSNSKDRNAALLEISNTLLSSSDAILAANQLDVDNAKKSGLSDALIDRLRLNPDRIKSMAHAVEAIAKQEEVVGVITSEHQRSDGLIIKKQRVPLGVIGMIFESRPNVVVDCAALAIKSGNAILLKGGREAENSNKALADVVRHSIKKFIPENVVQLVESRSEIADLLTLKDYIDVMIPRGGDQLIQYVYDNAKMPVIAHFKGICHGYVHADADLAKAKAICLNAKAQRPGVCNAMETLLLHKDLPAHFVEDLFNDFLKEGVELRLDSSLINSSIINSTIFKNHPAIKSAQEEDWQTEYLDKVLSVKQVGHLSEAISHIQKYGTRHTEFICTKDPTAAQQFQQQIDASCVMVNASSRFNDGGELGLGAEIGISTTKIHAYGPMGAREMTIERFLVEGQGHIRV